jgi:hypothetical protein
VIDVLLLVLVAGIPILLVMGIAVAIRCRRWVPTIGLLCISGVLAAGFVYFFGLRERLVP